MKKAKAWRRKALEMAREIPVILQSIARNGGDDWAPEIERLHRAWSGLANDKAMLVRALDVVEARSSPLKSEHDRTERARLLKQMCEAIAEATREEAFAAVDTKALEPKTRAYRSYTGPGQQRGDEWLLAVIVIRAGVLTAKGYRETPNAIARLVRLIKKYANEKER